MEHIQVVNFFTQTDKLYRNLCDGAHRQNTTASGITIQLRQYETGNLQLFMEAACNIHNILSGHCIDSQQNIIRMYKSLDIGQLLHQLFINMQTPGSIKQHGIIAVFLGIIHCLLRCFQRLGLHTKRKDLNANAFPQCLQLFNRCRTNNITGYQQRLAALLFLHYVGDLCGCRCFTGTLQTHHHDSCYSTAFIIYRSILASQQRYDFVMNDFYNHLPRIQRGHDLRSQCLFLYAGNEILNDAVINIGLQQRHTHLAQHVVHIFFAQLSLSGYIFKRLSQTFT